MLNRYSYCRNNPLIYLDPDGHFPWLVAIGAAIGAYQGYDIAQGNDANLFETMTYMVIGATIGGLSGGAAGQVADPSLAIMTASTIDSGGMYMLSGGETDFTVSAGAFSYNFSQGEFGYLGKPGNSGLQDLFYTIGAVANLTSLSNLGSDAWMNNGSIPDCPCELDLDSAGQPLGVGGKNWTEPTPNPLAHPGASWEIRWTGKWFGPGQQCTYDGRGTLLTTNLAAGTPDKFAFFQNLPGGKINPINWAHGTADLFPFIWDLFRGDPDYYWQYRRPPNLGANAK